MITLLLVLIPVLLGGALLSRHLLATFDEARFRPDALHRWIEAPLLRVIGVDPRAVGGWRAYVAALLALNALLIAATVAILMGQGALPLNPDRLPGLSWDLALHTAVSFVTNTDQQHYSGQAQLSYFSQCVALVTLQFLSPATGLAAAVAMLRGLRGGWQPSTDAPPQPGLLGNFHVDLLRGLTRVLLPLALPFALWLAVQGVPATWDGAAEATPIEAGAGDRVQRIPRGPVAALVAIKQLGTNGGGWFGPNGAMALENPTAASTLLQTVALLLLPAALLFASGPLLRRPRLNRPTVGTTLVLALAAIAIPSERAGGPALAAAGYATATNLEGKELRAGADASAVWATLTTQSSNGSVVAMHDSLNPGAAVAALAGMWLNTVWGGIGCGLIGLVVAVMITVFLAGLMVGRSPELFGRALDEPVVRGLALLVVLPPLVIHGLTAATLALPAWSGASIGGLHDLARIVYEYTSAFANNGSGFEGLVDATPWWNLTTTVALLLGRYPALVIPLAIAAHLSTRRAAPETVATLRLDGSLFAATFIAVSLLLTLLSFLPLAMLGPLGEGLAASHVAALPGALP
jgi:K+-transporting ATPase ATPase A chain